MKTAVVYEASQEGFDFATTDRLQLEAKIDQTKTEAHARNEKYVQLVAQLEAAQAKLGLAYPFRSKNLAPRQDAPEEAVVRELTSDVVAAKLMAAQATRRLDELKLDYRMLQTTQIQVLPHGSRRRTAEGLKELSDRQNKAAAAERKYKDDNDAFRWHGAGIQGLETIPNNSTLLKSGIPQTMDDKYRTNPRLLAALVGAQGDEPWAPNRHLIEKELQLEASKKALQQRYANMGVKQMPPWVQPLAPAGGLTHDQAISVGEANNYHTKAPIAFTC